MHRGMRSRARDLAQWGVPTFRTIKNKNPNLPDRSIYSQMLDQRVQFPGGEEAKGAVLDRYGSSLHGICYFLALNTGGMEGNTMVLRCLQFLQYLDRELKKAGAIEPAVDIRRDYFKKLALPESAVGKNHL